MGRGCNQKIVPFYRETTSAALAANKLHQTKWFSYSHDIVQWLYQANYSVVVSDSLYIGLFFLPQRWRKQWLLLTYYSYLLVIMHAQCACGQLGWLRLFWELSTLYLRLYTVFQKKWRQNSNHYNYGISHQN